ncbi:HET-domain-containing protein [Patellaria atrata CBS 101060]|uniref:HET-domain-containing protein n=1 Tax=Patellaria atrata CBS 101060 TaxID=1346257 RepID=A0A9P4SHJ8_9PEZI|nr:HET-domain-containing protein [Patellaria atrata CBS 101060]
MELPEGKLLQKISIQDRRTLKRLFVKEPPRAIATLLPPKHELYNFIDIDIAERIAIRKSSICPKCQAFARLYALIDHHRGTLGQWDVSDLLQQPTGIQSQPRIMLGSLQDLERESTSCSSCRKLRNTFTTHIGPRSSPEKADAHFVEFRIESFRQPSLLVCTTMDPTLEKEISVYAFTLIEESVFEKANSPNTLIYGKLLDPSTVAIQSAQNWINNCDRNHSGHCGKLRIQPLAEPIPIMTVIDLEHANLVEVSGSVRYVALSYVWGQLQESLASSKSNFEILRKPGGLKSEDIWLALPNTIKDAMQMLLAMGERYLWVDRLCIIQDDAENIASQLESMQSIYANAYFTLVAADGSTSDHGLPGVEGGSTPVSRQQNIWDLSPFCKILLVQRDVESEVTGSIWSRRAWTFQEELLSRRLLIYVNRHLRWHCLEATWREDLNDVTDETEGPLQRAAKLRVSSRFSRSVSGWNKQLGAKQRSFYHWARIASAYSYRRLSFQKDKLNALGGIMNMLSDMFETSFHFGLPECYFHETLLWQPRSHGTGMDSGLISRLEGEPDGFHRNTVFPSWSWAGWAGDGIEWAHGGLAQYSPQVYPTTTWYKIGTINNENPSLARILQSKRMIIEKFHPRAQDCQRFDEPLVPPYDNVPVDTSSNLSPTRHWSLYLFCQTDRIFLTIGARPGYPPSGQPIPHFLQWHWCFTENYHSLLDRDGAWAGNILIPKNPANASIEGTTCELINISAGEHSTGTGKLHKWYNVLWIAMDEGVAYRRALGMVCKDSWENEKPEKIDILIG